jgi:hypothetical protein
MSIRDIIEAATPGPWERGDHWWIQGADHCQCLDSYGPLVHEGCMNINGRMMEAHVHRMPEPITTEGITTAWLDERTHKPHSIVHQPVLVGFDADARFIATFDPEHVALMEAVCEAAKQAHYKLKHHSAAYEAQRILATAIAALAAYRKEHGL